MSDKFRRPAQNPSCCIFELVVPERVRGPVREGVVVATVRPDRSSASAAAARFAFRQLGVRTEAVETGFRGRAEALSPSAEVSAAADQLTTVQARVVPKVEQVLLRRTAPARDPAGRYQHPSAGYQRWLNGSPSITEPWVRHGSGAEGLFNEIKSSLTVPSTVSQGMFAWRRHSGALVCGTFDRIPSC